MSVLLVLGTACGWFAMCWIVTSYVAAHRRGDGLSREEIDDVLPWSVASHLARAGVSLVAGPLVAGLRPLVTLPFLGQLVAGVIVADLAFWCVHRLAHTSAWWRWHRVHHDADHMHAGLNERWHPMDAAAIALGTGLAVPLVAGPLAAGAVSLVCLAWSCWVHSDMRAPRWWPAWLTSPAYHAWHHAAPWELAEGRNYGAVVTWWDDLAGTALRMARLPSRYGA